jgi:nicotinate-nucleotide pyrophosphorylase (carboxylating)
MRSDLPDYITIAFVNELVDRALREDVGSGDVTSIATVGPGVRARARMEAREPGVVAGLWFAQQVFEAVDPSIQTTWNADDGDRIEGGASVASIEGPARSILTAERLALNVIQRMSGIATATARMVEIVKPYGTQILDTRKTAPGLRLLDKWAVRLGGGKNHRIGLFDMILIKDNHVAAAGGVRQAVEAATAFCAEDGRNLTIEVEVRTLDEVDEAMQLDPIDILLLDNMARTSPEGIDVSMLAEAVERIGGQKETEASGRITLETIEPIARTGVTYISSGALTHSARALDIGLNIEVVL